jgi:diaminopimelate epimerase
MTDAAGRPFWKMTGSGNDFVFFDSRPSHDSPDPLENTADITAICAQHLGIGADGVVFIAESNDASFGIRYYNADGSRATLCGNASLCAAQSAVRLGLASRERMFYFNSDAGLIAASIGGDGAATIRLAPVTSLETDAAEGIGVGEERVGFAVVGVPHLVILVRDVATIDVDSRGRTLRYGSQRAPAGANVNFVSPDASSGAWQMRTYERGVEAETYACGTGSVAAAACLIAWNLAPLSAAVRLKTASGKTLTVRLPSGSGAAYSELSGEGRVVFDGVLQAVR